MFIIFHTFVGVADLISICCLATFKAGGDDMESEHNQNDASFCYQCYEEKLQDEAEYQKKVKQQKRLMDLEVEKTILQLKLEDWENKLSVYLEEAMEASISPEKEELLKERIKNLLGMLMGVQQEIATIDTQIEHETDFVMEEGEKALVFDGAGSPLPKVERALQDTGLFHEDPSYPGVLFFENAVQESITDQGKFIDCEKQLGVTLWVPEGSVAAKEVANVIIKPSFSGTFAGPIDFDPVSPAYLIKTKKTVKFKKPVTLRIQHNASIETEKECEELVLMRAHITPHYRGTLFGPIYIFYPVNKKNLKFSLEDKQFGELKESQLDNWFMVWRKRKQATCVCAAAKGGHEVGKYLYSARLYKGDVGFRNRAVFCMCQQHPQYTKHCDEVIARKYVSCGMSGHPDRRIVKDGLTIADNDQIVLEGDAPLSLVVMDNDTITRSEIDLPRIANMCRTDFPDYPTRVHIHISAGDPESWTLNVMGLTEVVEFTVSAGYECVQVPERILTPKPRKEKLTPASEIKAPSLKTLSIIKWKDEQGCIQHLSLIKWVCVEWRDFGRQLNIAGIKLDSWEEEYDKKAEKCWKKVMNHWLKGRGSSEYPVTWEGLKVLLKDLQHTKVAELLGRAVDQVNSCTKSNMLDY